MGALLLSWVKELYGVFWRLTFCNIRPLSEYDLVG